MMSQPAIKIVHVLSTLTVGGAEINTIRLVGALADRDFDQIVVSLTPQIDSELQSALSVPLLFPPHTRRFPGGSVFLARVLQDHAADVIHGRAFVTWLDCGGAKALFCKRVRLVHSFHGPATFEDERLRRRITACCLRRRTDAFVAVSQDLASRLVGQWCVSPEKVSVIHNGIDVDRFKPLLPREEAKSSLGIERHVFVVGTMGSLRGVKNQALLIRAFSKFCAQIKCSLLLLIGDGPLRAELERLSCELGVRERVRFYGYQSAVQTYLDAMDVFVQPSTNEGSPTAVMEAMSSGIATVAARSAGCMELHAARGLPLLVDVNNEDDLMQLLLKLASDEKWRAALGHQGRQIISESYSFQKMVDSYEQLYRSLVSVDERLPGQVVASRGIA